jgi:hypothetical protein
MGQAFIEVVHIGDGTWAHADDAEVVEIPLDVWAENEESGVAVENYLKGSEGVRRPVVPDSAAASQGSSSTSTVTPEPEWRAPPKIPGVPEGSWGGECWFCYSDEGACWRRADAAFFVCTQCAYEYNDHEPGYFEFVPTLAT